MIFYINICLSIIAIFVGLCIDAPSIAKLVYGGGDLGDHYDSSSDISL